MDEATRALATIGSISSCLLLGTFIGVYAPRRWWRKPGGWYVMGQAAGLFILACMATAVQLFGDYPGRPFVRALVWPIFAVMAAVMLYFLIHWRRRPPGDEHE